ncbi:nucleotide exchange factor GrpE [Candidatus Daviesbacteria bacterium RIFOXYD1_FULL_41_10]|uniref:Protein GrpE n=2 Tax=Patescibacteria group TaxID=1783273 RepID=A0A1F5N1U6_9BACT|nr:MAG: Protein GrpE [Candidatus Azambacteria bacterium GW2011_GWA1_44_9]OGE71553.1 MAG: nucleotide exchange factor GrpE [Candidatus Daviesbacteria bacterium RIFOXYD1_FULL_41_10]
MTKKIEEIKQLEEKVNDLENQLKRAVADYHNLEKRINEGRSELTRLGISDFLLKIIPSLDHLEQAIKGAESTGEESGWLEGVKLAVKELRKVLAEEGLQEVDCSCPFDPNLHEAVEVEEGEEGRIIKVLQMGYNLNGKCIRPARVVVGKPSFAKATEDKGGRN